MFSVQPLMGQLLETGQLTLEDLKALEERHSPPADGATSQ